MNPILEKLIETFIKKTKTDPSKLVAKKPDEDFIPYVCHYDPNTILTKNGELLQIIRITGFSNSSVISELISLRDAVRDAVKTHVHETKFAFWFSTIRRKKNITPKGEFKDFFSAKVNEEWVKENKWNDQYVNELYVTVIIEGIDTSVINMKSFIRSFSYASTRSLHGNFLKEAHEKLSKVVSNILKETEEYGAKLLGILDWEGTLYSEPMRFFGKIVNLYEERYPLAANDISNDLASHKMAFGEREIEVVGYKNKNFATILSLKEYFEVSTGALDRILQLPFEFIITQSFDFIFNKKDLEHYEYQNYILKVSGDEDFRQISGAANFLESKSGLPTDYGKLQTTIMFINHTREALDIDVKAAMEQFNALGFVVIREDIFSEHCFWAQLPGNFRYLRRQKIINTYRVAGFAALHNFPAGTIAGNNWGPAVTVLRTVLNTPYFFNFHDGPDCHSLIMGPEGSGKTVLLNFLLTQARRFNGKLFYFDSGNSGKAFIKALSGHYYDMNHQEQNVNFLQLNPLLLPRNDQNRNFLADFFASLVIFMKGSIPENEIAFIPQIIDRILTANINNFVAATEQFNTPETRNIYEKLKIWSGEKLGYIFGAQSEINWSNQIMAFDLDKISAQKPLLIPIVNYLLYRIEMALDGSPSILVLNDAWELIDNAIMAPKINGFLERMKQKNCVVIFTSEKIEQLAESGITADIKKNLTTEIFMPNESPHQCYQDIFGLNDEEMQILRVMESDEHHFLFKHGDDAVIASFNLKNSDELLKIFSADEMTLAATEEVIAANVTEAQPNPEPKVWLPQLFEVLKEVESEKAAEEKERIRQEVIEKRKMIKMRQEAD